MHRSDGDEGIEGVFKTSQIKARTEGALQAAEGFWFMVDDQNPSLRHTQRQRDRVSEPTEKIDQVETSEAKVSAWGAEVLDGAFVRPVVDGFQVDLAECRNLGGGEKLWLTRDFLG